MDPRPATPGAMRLPQGAKEREKIQELEARMAALEARVAGLDPVSETKNKGGRPPKVQP